MKVKFHGMSESKEYLPRTATEKEAALFLKYLRLKDEIKKLSEAADAIVAQLPYQDPMYCLDPEAEGGATYTTFFVDKPEWMHVKRRDLDLESKPTTQADKKSLGL